MIKCIFTTKATAQQCNRIERQRFQFTCARERICAEKLRRTFFRSEDPPLPKPRTVRSIHPIFVHPIPQHFAFPKPHRGPFIHQGGEKRGLSRRASHKTLCDVQRLISTLYQREVSRNKPFLRVTNQFLITVPDYL